MGVGLIKGQLYKEEFSVVKLALLLKQHITVSSKQVHNSFFYYELVFVITHCGFNSSLVLLWLYCINESWHVQSTLNVTRRSTDSRSSASSIRSFMGRGFTCVHFAL